MKVAVTYENGRVFQHFGKTQMFLTADVSLIRAFLPVS